MLYFLWHTQQRWKVEKCEGPPGSRYSKCNNGGGQCYQEGVIPKGIELVDVNLPTLQCDHDSLPTQKKTHTHVPNVLPGSLWLCQCYANITSLITQLPLCKKKNEQTVPNGRVKKAAFSPLTATSSSVRHRHQKP